ncbi:uncharacterized protein AB675_7641 [Cyphellophora attinorum]|uniref:Uncharacterized protein n=1 Tax=Cyphellophora attinorum TaxID=1664694 RepID=A0A0N0NMS8_9EURO|nr:uncharacterized protein AB675_7641 [Phialophora attinorum]KPI40559.1 hypothetical protein AB675_7641 [Phialophora attinorum]
MSSSTSKHHNDESETDLQQARLQSVNTCQNVGWRSWKIKKRALIPLFTTTCLLTGGLVTILVLSTIWHGLIVVQDRSSRFAQINWKVSYAWTLLPAFVFQIYGLCFASVVNAYGARQPFVELARTDGAPASKSIALDYLSLFPGQREVKAGRRRHWFLLLAFTLADIFRIALGPLATHMMSLRPYTNTQRNYTAAIHNTSFNANPPMDESLSWDLFSVIGAVAGSLIYGASSAADTNGTHAFLSFSRPTVDRFATRPSATANTSMYFSEVDCVAMEDSALNIVRVVNVNSRDGNGGRWNINGTDRQCKWSVNMGIAGTYSAYLQTFPIFGCREDPSTSSSSRLIVVGAPRVENFNKSVPTVLSCMPSYWTASGRLSLSLETDFRDPVLGFAEESRGILKPQWWESLETQLNQVQSVDTTLNGGSTAVSATTLGRLILDNAHELSSGQQYDGKVLTAATRQVFAHTYATLVTQFMIQPSTPTNVQLDLTTTTNRLFVDEVVTGVVLGLMLVAAGVLSFAYFYGKTPSVLFEEPIGLLGYAGVLARSTVNWLVLANREAQDYCGETTSNIMQLITKRPGPQARFAMVDEANPVEARIQLRIPPCRSGHEAAKESSAPGNILDRALEVQDQASLAIVKALPEVAARSDPLDQSREGPDEATRTALQRMTIHLRQGRCWMGTRRAGQNDLLRKSRVRIKSKGGTTDIETCRVMS